MSLGVIILAAGQGTRMRSALPKVLHRLAGKPLLQHVLDTASLLRPAKTVVVYGHGGRQVPDAFAGRGLSWVEQSQQLGTGHAVAQALPAVAGLDRVLILFGDVPLITAGTLQQVCGLASSSPLVVLTVPLSDPEGYGRILRDPEGRICRIVEQRDATAQEREVAEVNSGIMAFDRARLEGWLARLNNRNAQGEYYLTDVIRLAVEDAVPIASAQPQAPDEILGVNDRVQLARLERLFQGRQAQELMRQGVGLADPGRFDLRGCLHAGRDVFVDVNAVIEGEVILGDGVQIGPNCLLRDCRIGDGSTVFANTVIEQAHIGARVCIGPFARIRPDTRLADQVHVGNFVEIKKSDVGAGSKINHLSYVGDSSVGSAVNVGAGTITCNYDGANKYRTVIGDQAFIGSNTALVAPVTVGAGATIGAGSVITRDAPVGKLSVARGRQVTIDTWRRPTKDEP
jgi:bifunctional UDP-N-acetylglucosamine pyrophosphorylase/glucosamine-1-phosphate N-acetyltransferase